MNPNSKSGGKVERARQRLLDGAAEALAELGYAAATIHTICERAGVSVGSFYYHFDDKPALTLELLGQAQEKLLEILREVDVNSPASIEVAVLEVLQGSDAALRRALREAAEVEPRFGAAYREAWTRAGDLLATSISARRARDTHYAVEAPAIAWAFLALLREAIAGRGDPGQPVDRTIAALISCSAPIRKRSPVA
jgi:AcrR family transcriptional regulator